MHGPPQPIFPLNKKTRTRYQVLWALATTISIIVTVGFAYGLAYGLAALLTELLLQGFGAVPAIIMLTFFLAVLGAIVGFSQSTVLYSLQKKLPFRMLTSGQLALWGLTWSIGYIMWGPVGLIFDDMAFIGLYFGVLGQALILRSYRWLFLCGYALVLAATAAVSTTILFWMIERDDVPSTFAFIFALIVGVTVYSVKTGNYVLRVLGSAPKYTDTDTNGSAA